MKVFGVWGIAALLLGSIQANAASSLEERIYKKVLIKTELSRPWELWKQQELFLKEQGFVERAGGLRVRVAMAETGEDFETRLSYVDPNTVEITGLENVHFLITRTFEKPTDKRNQKEAVVFLLKVTYQTAPKGNEGTFRINEVRTRHSYEGPQGSSSSSGGRR